MLKKRPRRVTPGPLRQQEDDEENQHQPIKCTGNCVGVQGKLQVVWSTVVKYPGILILPVLLFAIFTGLGVFGVLAGRDVIKNSRRTDALQIANSTLSAFALTVQQALAPVLSVGVYLERQPNWTDFAPQFNSMARTLLNITSQDTQLVQLEVAPYGIIKSLYPDVVGGQDLNLLACCGTDVMREVTAKRLNVDGPFAVQPEQNSQRVIIASLPVFVNSTVAGPGPDPRWNLPPQENGTCNVTACSTEIAPNVYSKWYGQIYAIILVDRLVNDSGTKIPDLQKGNWAYRLYRSSPGVIQPDVEKPVVAASGRHISDPVVANVTVSGSMYEIELEPEAGWTEPWWPAVITSVVLISALICILLFITLLSKRQNSWLLYSILPRKVVKTLRRGNNWTQKSDCCVLFADVVQFTRITANMSPEKIAAMVGQLFAVFEELTSQHEMTKVDIIGDCFMAVSGMLYPDTPEECAVKACRLALDMVRCTEGLVTEDGDPVQVRVGLHAGPVVAVVLGIQSPKLTIFGDVVNTCSRLQSTSLPGCVQVSSIVADRLIAAGSLAKGLVLTERGPVSLRNRGVVNTWWVMGELGSGLAHGRMTDDETARQSSMPCSLAMEVLHGNGEHDVEDGHHVLASSHPLLGGRALFSGSGAVDQMIVEMVPAVPSPSPASSNTAGAGSAGIIAAKAVGGGRGGSGSFISQPRSFTTISAQEPIRRTGSSAAFLAPGSLVLGGLAPGTNSLSLTGTQGMEHFGRFSHPVQSSQVTSLQHGSVVEEQLGSSIAPESLDHNAMLVSELTVAPRKQMSHVGDLASVTDSPGEAAQPAQQSTSVPSSSNALPSTMSPSHNMELTSVDQSTSSIKTGYHGSGDGGTMPTVLEPADTNTGRGVSSQDEINAQLATFNQTSDQHPLRPRGSIASSNSRPTSGDVKQAPVLESVFGKSGPYSNESRVDPETAAKVANQAPSAEQLPSSTLSPSGRLLTLPITTAVYQGEPEKGLQPRVSVPYDNPAAMATRRLAISHNGVTQQTNAYLSNLIGANFLQAEGNKAPPVVSPEDDPNCRSLTKFVEAMTTSAQTGATQPRTGQSVRSGEQTKTPSLTRIGSTNMTPRFTDLGGTTVPSTPAVPPLGYPHGPGTSGTTSSFMPIDASLMEGRRSAGMDADVSTVGADSRTTSTGSRTIVLPLQLSQQGGVSRGSSGARLGRPFTGSFTEGRSDPGALPMPAPIAVVPRLTNPDGDTNACSSPSFMVVGGDQSITSQNAPGVGTVTPFTGGSPRDWHANEVAPRSTQAGSGDLTNIGSAERFAQRSDLSQSQSIPSQAAPSQTLLRGLTGLGNSASSSVSSRAWPSVSGKKPTLRMSSREAFWNHDLSSQGGSVLKYAGKQPLGVTAAADIRAAADTQQQQRTMLPNIEDNTDAV